MILRSAFLFVSLALHCTDCNLGTRAAAKIPIITMTMSISIRVKLEYHFCFIKRQLGINIKSIRI